MRRLVVICALLALASVATAEDRARAEQYFRAGAQAFAKQSYAAAIEQFELAYKELPMPEIAFSAAQAYRRGYYIDQDPYFVSRAVELYRVYLTNVKTGGRVGDASDGLAEMQAVLDKLEAKGTKIEQVKQVATRLAVSVVVGDSATRTLELSAIPTADTSGARATLDGKPIALYEPVDVAPGPHTIEVTADGYFPQRVEKRAVEGISDLVEVRLQPKAATLAVRTERGAEIAINGRPGSTRQELPAGKYLVMVTHRGRHPFVREVVLAKGETRTIDAGLVKTTRRRLVPWIAGAAGVFGVAAGLTAIVAVRADNRMSALDTKRLAMGLSSGELDSYRDSVNRRDTFKSAAWLTGGLAVATGATALALYLFDNPSLDERTIVPSVGPQGTATLSVMGSF